VVVIQVRKGLLVDSVRFNFSNGASKFTPFYGNGFGGGAAPVFQLSDGEYIAGINGRAGDHLDQVQFVTNKGRTSLTYGGRGGSAFVLRAPAGKSITGLSNLRTGGRMRVGMILADADTGKPSPTPSPTYRRRRYTATYRRRRYVATYRRRRYVAQPTYRRRRYVAPPAYRRRRYSAPNRRRRYVGSPTYRRRRYVAPPTYRRRRYVGQTGVCETSTGHRCGASTRGVCSTNRCCSSHGWCQGRGHSSCSSSTARYSHNYGGACSGSLMATGDEYAAETSTSVAEDESANVTVVGDGEETEEGALVEEGEDADGGEEENTEEEAEGEIGEESEEGEDSLLQDGEVDDEQGESEEQEEEEERALMQDIVA